MGRIREAAAQPVVLDIPPHAYDVTITALTSRMHSVWCSDHGQVAILPTDHMARAQVRAHIDVRHPVRTCCRCCQAAAERGELTHQLGACPYPPCDYCQD